MITAGIQKVLLKADSRPAAQGTLHGPRPKAHFTTRGLAACFTVHAHPAVQFRIFVSGIFYSACSDLCSKMEKGEFWFLCNFTQSFPSPAILASFCCFLLKKQTLDSYCRRGTVDVETMHVWRDLKPLLHFATTFEGLQNFETIEITKKPKLTFFYFGTQIRTCAVTYRWQKL